MILQQRTAEVNLAQPPRLPLTRAIAEDKLAEEATHHPCATSIRMFGSRIMPASRALGAAAALVSATMVSTMWCDSQQPATPNAGVTGPATQEFWAARWQAGKTGWKLTQPHPFLVKYRNDLLGQGKKQQERQKALGAHTVWELASLFPDCFCTRSCFNYLFWH